MKKRINIIAFFISWVVIIANASGQQRSSIETITLNPHDDVRIVFEQLKDQKIKHGKYTYYHRNLKIVEGHFLVGKKHGRWQRYYQDGSVSIDAFYLQDEKHGNWKYYYTNGNLQSSINFNRGIRIGKWTSWYLDSGPSSELTYENDSLIGLQKIYYKNQQLTMGAKSPHLHISVNIRYDGSKKLMDFEKYYSNGKLFERFTQWDEKKVGMYTSYYNTGLLWKKMKFEDDGRLFSIYEYNNPVGRDANRSSFWDGNGELISYYRNGDKHARTNYVNGLKDGKFTLYEEDTKELVTGYYNDNVQIGTWTYYKTRVSKKEVVTEKHYTGKDTATVSLFSSDLQARDAGVLIRGKKNGIWRSYYPNNKLKEESILKMGLNHGTSKGYRVDTQLDFVGGYYYGLKVGEWKYYNDFGKVVFKENFITQVSADENYLFSDSCRSGRDRKYLNYYNFLEDGKTTQLDLWWKNDGVFSEDYKPIYPTFIPWQIVKRPDVANDNDIGLFLQTLNPRKLKVKGDKKSPNVGAALVVLNIDEFGFVERARLVRGIHPEWDQKILSLFSIYQYWEPALYLNQPTASALEMKISIHLEVVKRME